MRADAPRPVDGDPVTSRAPRATPTTPRSRPVGAATRGTLLLNPRSGGGKVGRHDLETEAARRGITPVVMRPGDDLRVLAERAVLAGADVLGVAGGDGSQAPVADIAQRHGVALVCVPAGTRNHFAHDLGVDRADVVAALDAFGAAIERRVDLAAVGDRVFVNNASLGLYAAVVQSQSYRHAKIGTALRMLVRLRGPGTAAFDLRLERPDGVGERGAELVVVSNNAYRFDTLTGLGTRPRLDGHVLGIVTLTLQRHRDVLTLLAATARGTVDRFAGFREWTAPDLVVESDSPLVDVGLDGEAQRLEPPLVFRSLPGALRVRIPPQQASPVSPSVAAPGAAGSAEHRHDLRPS